MAVDPYGHTMTNDDPKTERTLIRTGRKFEHEYRLNADDVGAFLISLGEQLRDGDELTIVDDEWELPFAFGEPIEIEIDFDGVGDPELEIELELPGRTDDSPPRIE
jgi:amphi-Trp domain-containing protein